MSGAATEGRPRRRRLPRRLARGLATLVYRDIDVRPPPAGFPSGPTLAVSNHFGGLSDGVLLVDSAPRMPRVIARDLIWRVPVVGSLATAAGMIPVHRAADGAGSNDASFAAAYAALREQDLVLIFPEGVTQDVPYMATVRTGAARIVLGARNSGVEGIRVLPVGLHYEDKAGFRSRALVNVGEPIDVDAWAADRPDAVADGAEDRDAVDALTAVIDVQLRRAAPDFPDWDTADALATVAEVLLDDVDARPREGEQYGDAALLASRLNRLPEPGRGELIAAGTAYRSALARHRTSDRALVAGERPSSRSPWRSIGDAVLTLLLLPYALIGLLIALLPLIAVTVVSRLPLAPAVRATIVPAVALVTFLGEWAFFSWQSLRDEGWEFGLLSVLLFPVFVAMLFFVAERLSLLWQGWRRHRRPSPQVAVELRALRARVGDLAWGAVSDANGRAL